MPGTKRTIDSKIGFRSWKLFKLQIYWCKRQTKKFYVYFKRLWGGTECQEQSTENMINLETIWITAFCRSLFVLLSSRTDPPPAGVLLIEDIYRYSYEFPKLVRQKSWLSSPRTNGLGLQEIPAYQLKLPGRKQKEFFLCIYFRKWKQNVELPFLK